MSQPQHPIYIISKGRAEYGPRTAHVLDRLGVPFRIVVETQEVDEYEKAGHTGRIIVLDQRYQDEYETCDDLGDTLPVGAGAARNFVKAHSREQGDSWHWVMDDNIRQFYRFHANRQIRVNDGSLLRFAEDFTKQYSNIAISGPEYYMFVPRKRKLAPVALNRRIFSCFLVRNEMPFTFRGRYNEDVIHSLDILRGGWMTMMWYFLLAQKLTTQTQRGGNTDQLYADGTRMKSNMARQVHPEYSRLTYRFGREHHKVNYAAAAKVNRLVRDPDVPQAVAPTLELVERRAA